MKMVNFRTGDKVVTIKDGELVEGVIKKFYPINPPVFIVEFSNGTAGKVLYNNVAPAPKNHKRMGLTIAALVGKIRRLFSVKRFKRDN